MPPLTVTIEKLVPGGLGLARTADGVIFVRDVAAGEIVAAEITGKKGGCPVARPLEIIEPSTARRKPPCALAGICGGCDWLHLSYENQLSAKKEIFSDCLRRLGRIAGLPAVEILHGDEFSYRRRAQIKIDGRGVAGFFARETNDVVCVAACPLLVDSLNALLADLAGRKLLPPPAVKNLMVIAGDNGAIASSPLIPGRTHASVAISVGARNFEVPGNGFFQSNRPLLERFGAWPRSHVSGDFCVDIYGGTGFFSVMLADRFKRGLLIESAGDHVSSARKNFSRNNIPHFKALEGAAENLASLTESRPIDCLVIDPPRPGLTRKTRESIAALRPKTILYVSCNPATQARDLGFLVNKAGYAIKKAALFDLYPNTHHIESMVVLS